MSKRLLLCALAAASAAVAAACGSTGTAAHLEIVDVSTGYYGVGVVNGENKIVPSITFSLRNTGDAPVSSVQVNAYFQAEDADGPMDEVLSRAIGSDALAPGGTTAPFTVRSSIGYTSQQTRAEMLKNDLFRDVRVRVFAKSGAEQWTLVDEVTVDRTILTR